MFLNNHTIILSSFNLLVVIHTVGPRGEKPKLLKNCYNSVLTLAKEKKIRSIALCGISTGIFGYPLENASRIACETVRYAIISLRVSREVLWDVGDNGYIGVERLLRCGSY
jgi:O-acetyl-ADP-ribose deacetylase (regulator of RNase III)